MEHIVTGLIIALGFFGACTAAAIVQAIGSFSADACWWPIWEVSDREV
jgi:hypothetical protein